MIKCKLSLNKLFQSIDGLFSKYFLLNCISIPILQSLITLAFLLIFSLFAPSTSIWFILMSLPCAFGGYFIYRLWKVNDSYKNLNDFLLYIYASYIVVNKLLQVNTDLHIPVNVSFEDFINTPNKVEYLNLFVFLFIAICTFGKTFISYASFLRDYRKNNTDTDADTESNTTSDKIEDTERNIHPSLVVKTTENEISSLTHHHRK